MRSKACASAFGFSANKSGDFSAYSKAVLYKHQAPAPRVIGCTIAHMVGQRQPLILQRQHLSHLSLVGVVRRHLQVHHRPNRGNLSSMFLLSQLQALALSRRNKRRRSMFRVFR
jgi:hypothetical protein